MCRRAFWGGKLLHVFCRGAGAQSWHLGFVGGRRTPRRSGRLVDDVPPRKLLLQGSRWRVYLLCFRVFHVREVSLVLCWRSKNCFCRSIPVKETGMVDIIDVSTHRPTYGSSPSTPLEGPAGVRARGRVPTGGGYFVEGAAAPPQRRARRRDVLSRVQPPCGSSCVL